MSTELDVLYDHLADARERLERATTKAQREAAQWEIDSLLERIKAIERG